MREVTVPANGPLPLERSPFRILGDGLEIHLVTDTHDHVLLGLRVGDALCYSVNCFTVYERYLQV